MPLHFTSISGRRSTIPPYIQKGVHLFPFFFKKNKVTLNRSERRKGRLRFDFSNKLCQTTLCLVACVCGVLTCPSTAAGYWLKAKVQARKPDYVCVHFYGWSSRHDETIAISSRRLAVCGTKAQQQAPKVKRKVEPAIQPPAVRPEMWLDVADQSDNDKMDDECGCHSMSTPIGNISLGDCLLLKPSNRRKNDELCTVSSISCTAIQVKCSWTGLEHTIDIKDLRWSSFVCISRLFSLP